MSFTVFLLLKLDYSSCPNPRSVKHLHDSFFKTHRFISTIIQLLLILGYSSIPLLFLEFSNNAFLILFNSLLSRNYPVKISFDHNNSSFHFLLINSQKRISLVIQNIISLLNGIPEYFLSCKPVNDSRNGMNKM